MIVRAITSAPPAPYIEGEKLAFYERQRLDATFSRNSEACPRYVVELGAASAVILDAAANEGLDPVVWIDALRGQVRFYLRDPFFFDARRWCPREPIRPGSYFMGRPILGLPSIVEDRA